MKIEFLPSFYMGNKIIIREGEGGKNISLIVFLDDDQSVSIQMRGGPEPLMVTGWAQIMSLDPDDIGVYHCVAANSEGKVHAMATVGVYQQGSEL